MSENPESSKAQPGRGAEPESSGRRPEPDEAGFTGYKPDSTQPVWTYRGYQLRGGEFTTAMVHFFRAEISRANVWRQRLDATTNWAVITTAAVITLIFGTNDAPHLVILLNVLLITMFLIIEGRRYRYYELWSSRIRLMETDFFAAMLVPPFQPSPEWAEALAENLLHPSFPISNLEALGRRLRRNYIWIYLVITAAWFVHVLFKPEPANSWARLVENASFAGIPGEFVLLIGMAAFSLLVLFALITIPMQHAAGEVLPRFTGISPSVSGLADSMADQDLRAWFRPTRRRRQLMTLIITDQAKPVTDKIFQEMHRGVTAIPGTGMYTGKEHTVLLCALTITEIPHLRSLINQVDPQAFVIISPAQEVFGRGFMPLEKER